MNEIDTSCPSLTWKNAQISHMVSYLNVCCRTIDAIDKRRGEIAALRRAVCESAKHYSRTRHHVAEYIALMEAAFPSATSCHLDEARISAIKMQSALDHAIEALNNLPDCAVVQGGDFVRSMEGVISDLFVKTRNNAEMLLRLLDIAEGEISSLQEVLVNLAG